MKRIGLITCENLPEPDPDETLTLAAFAAAGLEAELVAWDDPGADPAAFDVCILRSCWNYHEHLAAFRQWLAYADQRTTLVNPLPVLEWNLDKRYLMALESSGVPIVPSRWLPAGEPANVAAVMQEPGWSDVVVKPTVSAGSANTQRFRDRVEAQEFAETLLASRDLMIQPYLPSVETVGETSVVVIAGRISHQVVKAPRFSNDEESVSDAKPPGEAETRLARRILEALPFATPLYARVDIMTDETGELRLSELELLEPSLFFQQHPPALAAFVRATQTYL